MSTVPDGATRSKARAAPQETFEQIANAYISEHLANGMDKFQLALSLKLMLDDLRDNIDDPEYESDYLESGLACDNSPRGELIILTADYTLSKLYSDVELPLNPFLSHLIDTYMFYNTRLEGPDGRVSRLDSEEVLNYIDVRIHMARYALIKHTLLGQVERFVGPWTPQGFVADQPTYGEETFALPHFSKSWFLAHVAGQDSIVWRDANALATFKDSVSALFPHLKDLSSIDKLAPESEPEEELTLALVVERLERQDYAVIDQLRRLDLTNLRYLDLLTKVLEYVHRSPGIEEHFIDVPTFVRDVLQSTLRQIELIGREDNSTLAPGQGDFEDGNAQQSKGKDIRSTAQPAISRAAGFSAHRRQDQKRAVMLLCLFVTHMLRHKMVGLTTILFEVRELSMQYLWVPEARALKQEFIMQGPEDDGSRVGSGGASPRGEASGKGVG